MVHGWIRSAGVSLAASPRDSQINGAGIGFPQEGIPYVPERTEFQR